jgi:hypothetical protein
LRPENGFPGVVQRYLSFIFARSLSPTWNKGKQFWTDCGPEELHETKLSSLIRFDLHKTNILDAMNIVDATLQNHVKKVIALSTDRACNPNVKTRDAFLCV